MALKLNYTNLFDYLVDAGICQENDLPYLKVDVNSKTSDWVIHLPPHQDKLFIKQLPDSIELGNGIRTCKEWQVYKFFQSRKSLDCVSSLIPELLHSDGSNSILIYTCSGDYITLKSHLENQTDFPTLLAESVGTALAKLHSQTMNDQDCYTFLTGLKESKLDYQFPAPDSISDYLVSRLEPEHLKKLPVSCWRFLGFFQQADAVREIVTELRSNHRRCCLTHNNFTFSNIFVSKHWKQLISEIQNYDQSPIKIVDWEACEWGDPACDLGKAILGYFLFWINSMIVHPAIEIKKSIQTATIPLEAVRPAMVAMTKAYINSYSEILENHPDFLKGVIQFAGLGLIEQLLTEFQFQPEIALSHQELYFFIAARLLCKPETFLAT